MALVSTLIEEIRDELHGEWHQEWNVVNGAQTISDTVIELSDSVEGLGVGSIMGIGNELLYVRSMSGQNATVIRGFRGTTAAAIAASAMAEVNPRFPVPRIRRAIQDEIRSWPASVFYATLETLSVGSGGRHMVLSRSDAYRILEMRRDASDTDLTRDTYPLVSGSWDMTRAGPAGKAGYGVQFGGLIPAGHIHVLYAVPFDVSTVEDSVELQDDVGLPVSLNEVVRWGVMWRMASREEFDRIDLSEQGQSRDAQEVAPGQIPTFARYCKQMRDQRLAQEADRLRALYPVRRG